MFTTHDFRSSWIAGSPFAAHCQKPIRVEGDGKCCNRGGSYDCPHQVNGRDVTGRTQEELVAMLRSTKQGETASLVIARQEGAFLPRELVMCRRSLLNAVNS